MCSTCYELGRGIFLTSQRLPCACAECWRAGSGPRTDCSQASSCLGEQHLADGGDRTSARDGRDSHRHDGHVLDGGEVLLRMDWG